MPVQTRWGLGGFTVRTWNKFRAQLMFCEQTGAACPPLVMLLLVGLSHTQQERLCGAFVFRMVG